MLLICICNIDSKYSFNFDNSPSCLSRHDLCTCIEWHVSSLGAIVLPTGSFSGELSIVLSDVECEGNESSLLDCPGNTSPVECDSGEGSAIICQGKDILIYICIR